jgi:hypothetical protein
MLHDSNGFKPYICFDFHNMSMYHTHIYILLALHQNPLNIEFFEWFLRFSELPRQFSPDMSGLWPRHVQVSGFQGI